jgi:hypothetical protein
MGLLLFATDENPAGDGGTGFARLLDKATSAANLRRRSSHAHVSLRTCVCHFKVDCVGGAGAWQGAVVKGVVWWRWRW